MVTGERSGWLRTLGIALVIIGLALLIVGVVYFTVPLDKLPSFMGHVANSTRHHKKRGLAVGLAGLVCWVGAAVAFVQSRGR